MTEVVKVFVLYCAQGNTNWIEHYARDTDKIPAHTAIFDMGTENKFNKNGIAAIEWIYKRIQGFYPDTADPENPISHKIDFVGFSHQDLDHWNLCKDFIAKRPAHPVISIGEIFRGGNNWGRGASLAVQRLSRKFVEGKPEIGILPLGRSDYGGKETVIATFGGCKVRVVLTGFAPTTVVNATNDPSLVLAIELGGKSIILSADATWGTMIGVNRIYKGNKNVPNRPAPCSAMTLPHHGSYATAVDEDATEMKHVEQFRKYLDPEGIVASAGYMNKHDHPRDEIIKLFEKGKRIQPDVPHDIYSYSLTDGGRTLPRTISSWTTVTTAWASVDASSDGNEAIQGSRDIVAFGVPRRLATGDPEVFGARTTKQKQQNTRKNTKKRKRKEETESDDSGSDRWVPEAEDGLDDLLDSDDSALTESERERLRKKKTRLINKATMPTEFGMYNIEYSLTATGTSSFKMSPAMVQSTSRVPALAPDEAEIAVRERRAHAE